MIPSVDPVHKGPVSQILNQTGTPDPALEPFQNPVDDRTVFPDQIHFSGLPIIILHHENKVDVEYRDHLWLPGRIAGLKQSVWHQGAAEILHGLFGELRISAYHIGEQDLRTGIHRILKLLIIRAVLVSLMHAALQRPQADIPYPVDPGSGGLHIGYDIQRVSGFQKRQRIKAHGICTCVHLQPDKAEGTEPERLICLLFLPAGRQINILMPRQNAVFRIIPYFLFYPAVFRCPTKAFRIADMDGAVCSAPQPQNQETGRQLSRIQNRHIPTHGFQ